MTTAESILLDLADELDAIEIAAVDPLTELADLLGSSQDARGRWKPTPIYDAFMAHASGVADMIDRARFLLSEHERCMR